MKATHRSGGGSLHRLARPPLRRLSLLSRKVRSLDKNRVEFGRRKAQRLELAILIRVVPTVCLLETRKFNENGEHWPPITFKQIAFATNREIAAAKMSNRRKHFVPIVFQLFRINNF